MRHTVAGLWMMLVPALLGVALTVAAVKAEELAETPPITATDTVRYTIGIEAAGLDSRKIFEAAKRYLQGNKLTPAQITAVIGTSAKPDIGACLQQLLSRDIRNGALGDYTSADYLRTTVYPYPLHIAAAGNPPEETLPPLPEPAEQ